MFFIFYVKFVNDFVLGATSIMMVVVVVFWLMEGLVWIVKRGFFCYGAMGR